MTHRIVVLDGYALNPGDLAWSGLEKLAPLTVHDRTPESEILARAADATVLLTNKTPLREAMFDHLPNLKFICVLATGFNIVDAAAARKRGIAVSNIPAYGTDSVAQLTMALLLELALRTQRHADDVASGGWVRNPDWSYRAAPLMELSGKTMGIVGYGRIGRRVGQMAAAFGMNIIAAESAAGGASDVPRVAMGKLLIESDVISLHCPLTPETNGFISSERISLMKTSAFLLNTSRGPLVVEADLAEALNCERIAGAGLDVLSTEPPSPANPLLTAKNCIITPHMAWATYEARRRLMAMAEGNVGGFLGGAPVNVVN